MTRRQSYTNAKYIRLKVLCPSNLLAEIPTSNQFAFDVISFTYNMLIISALSLILHVWWAQSSPLIPHEKRDLDQDIEDVVDRRRVRAETIIPMRIALKENTNALLDAESWLTKISHPDSAHYGRHWRQDEVISAFQPADDTVQIVGQWLKDHDIFDFVQTDNKMWFAFDVSAAKAEVLLQTEMYERDVRDSHGDLSRIEAFCAQYHLPPRISQHVDFVLPGVQGSDITDRTDKGRLLLKRGGESHIYWRRNCSI